MSGGLNQVQNRRAQRSAAGATGPMPGGKLTLPADKNPIMAMTEAVMQMPDISQRARSQYILLIIQKNGGPPQAGQTIDLPTLAELQGAPGAAPEPVTEQPVDRIDHRPPRRPEPMGDARSPGTDAALKAGSGGSVSVRSGGHTVGVLAPARPVVRLDPTRGEPINPQVEARKLEQALRRGNMESVYEIFHGKSQEDQQAIIREFDELPYAADTEVPVMQGSNYTASGMIGNWIQKKVGATRTQHNDLQSRLERMGDRQRFHVQAYLENPSSQLEPADKLYLSMRGAGTYEEGLYRNLRNLTRSEIEQQAILYAQRYHGIQNPSVTKATAILQGDLEGELSGSDKVKALLYLRGKDNLTEADRQALELYTWGAGMIGTEEEPIYRLLEGESGANIGAIATAYRNLPGVSDSLFDDLDGELDGIWYERMEAAYQGSDAPKDTRAKYVAHSAELYLRGKLEWEDMSRILTTYVDPTGLNGPTVADVERMFTEAGYWGDMTQRMGFEGAEVKALVEVLESGADVRDSPRAKAIRFYHQTTGKIGTDEEGAFELLAAIPSHERAELDREFQAYSKQMSGREWTVEQAIRDDFSDSPRWMDRALDHWQNGVLPVENLLYHVSRGAGEGSEVVRAMARVPASQRAAIKQAYVQKYFAPDPPTVDGPLPTDVSATAPLGADARWDGVIERMETGFRQWQRQGHGLNSIEGRDNMMRLASTMAVQLGVDIIRTQGDEGVEALAARPNLEVEILSRLQAANQRDRADGRIGQDNLQRIAAHIAGVVRGEWPEFDRAASELGDREGRSVDDLIAAGNIGNEGVEGLKARVNAQIDRERGDWNSISRQLMDKFGWTGEFVDEAGRDFFLEIERASADGELTQEELQGVLNRYSELIELVKEYQEEKDQTGEIAGDIAAAAAAMIVTIASGGSAAPLIVTIAAATAGAAKVGTERAFRGQDYQMGSAEFWKDLAVGGIDGVVTVYTVGMAKVATTSGATFMRAVMIEANAAGLGASAATMSRVAMDEMTWEEGFLAGMLNVGEGGLMGYGLGFGMGFGLSAMIRGGSGGIQRLRMRAAQNRAAQAPGKGKVSSDVITDSHGHAGDVRAQLGDRQGPVLRHGGDIIDKADGASHQGLVNGQRVGGGSRAALNEIKAAEVELGGRIQISYGNHEQMLGAALDDVAFYGSREGRVMFRDTILRAADATGDAAIDKAVRLETARQIRGMLQRHGSTLSREAREQLEGVANVFSRGDAAAMRSAGRILDRFDDDVGRMLLREANLNKDVALRRLLGKPSTNFAQSVLEGYDIVGDAAMGTAMRREMAGKLRMALQQHGANMSDEARVAMNRFADQLEDMSERVGGLKLLDQFDDAIGDLVEHSSLTRRDVLMLHSAASSINDAQIAAKRIFLAYADAAGDMTKAQAAVRQLAQEYGMDPAVLTRHLQGMQAMSDDFDYIFERMVAFQIDPQNGALITHAGWPYSVVDGKTVLRPDRLIEAQRRVQKGRWLGIFRHEQLHLDPSSDGEEVIVTANTG
ncbi:MAG: hypothetical protein V3T05_13420, partial [Myxococcota bacterium]